MQWHSHIYKFVPCNNKLLKLGKNPRKRVFTIESDRPHEPNLNDFNSPMISESSITAFENILALKGNTLSIPALEECILYLVQHGGKLADVHRESLERLHRIGALRHLIIALRRNDYILSGKLFDYRSPLLILDSAYHELVDPPCNNHILNFRNIPPSEVPNREQKFRLCTSPGSLLRRDSCATVIPESIKSSKRPCKELNDTSHIPEFRKMQFMSTKNSFEICRANYFTRLQHNLNTCRGFVNSSVQNLYYRWAHELSYRNFTSDDEDMIFISKHLSYSEQCKIVSHYFANIVDLSIKKQFPIRLEELCKKLGERIEHGLLESVAKRLGLDFIHRKSEYVYSHLNHSGLDTFRIGAYWAQKAIDSCRYSQKYLDTVIDCKAFWNKTIPRGSKQRGIFLVDKRLLMKLKQRDDGISRNISISQLPLFVPPRPWTGLFSANTGPLTFDLKLAKGLSEEGKASISEAIYMGNMNDCMKGLNKLQSQSWVVNEQVLNVIQFDYKNGYTMGIQTAKDKKKYILDALNIACALKTLPFYTPWYMDFRGRCYPKCNSPLSPMSQDNMRALFLFETPRKLNKDGLKWLEIHLANIYGAVQKASTFNERVQWTHSNYDNILKTAKDPLAANNSWWRQAKKPYQALSVCYELAKIYNTCKTPEEISQFESQLPVHIDGTSNGLQHLVALTKDENNSASVNLKLQTDIEDHSDSVWNYTCNDIYTSIRSKLPGKYTREEIKQTAMIFCFGGRYDSNALTHAFSKIFAKQKEAIEWIKDCCARILVAKRAHSNGASIAWTSPLGMPVVQPYVQPPYMAVETSLQTFYLESPHHQAAVNAKKQLNAIVPNFIHSLDASHMLLTAAMIPDGMNFCAIHDNFWTAAGDMSQLSHVTRQSFAKLHQRNILQDLKHEFIERYKGYCTLVKVYADSPLYETIIHSRNGTGAEEESKYLEKELYFYYDSLTNTLSACDKSTDITNIINERVDSNGIAQLGTKGAYVRAWMPLKFSNPPSMGTFNVDDVIHAKYFFS